jgi:uncharacterized protein YjbJ (UPF0337 family)
MAGAASQAKGRANVIAGKARKAFGRVTGNKKLRAKGAAQEAKGRAQNALGRTDRKLRGAANSL